MNIKHISEFNNLQYISEGLEGKVYKYKNQAIKVYHECPKKEPLNLNVLLDLSNIKTKRIMLPEGVILDGHDFTQYYRGYIMPFIKGKNHLENSNDINLELLKEEEKIFDEDLKILAENNVSIFDLRGNGNFIFNNGFYFIDSGSFFINPYGNVEEYNLNDLNFALYIHLFCFSNQRTPLINEVASLLEVESKEEYIKLRQTYELLKCIYYNDYLDNFKENGKYISYLQEIIREYNNLQNYKSKLLKEAVKNEEYEFLYEKQMEQLRSLVK